MAELIAALIVMVGLVVVNKMRNADVRKIALLDRGKKTQGKLVQLKAYNNGSWVNKGKTYQGVYEFTDIRGHKYKTIEMVYEFQGKYGETDEELAKGIKKEIVYLESQPKISRVYAEVAEEGMPSIGKLSLMIIMIAGIITVAVLLLM